MPCTLTIEQRFDLYLSLTRQQTENASALASRGATMPLLVDPGASGPDGFGEVIEDPRLARLKLMCGVQDIKKESWSWLKSKRLEFANPGALFPDPGPPQPHGDGAAHKQAVELASRGEWKPYGSGCHWNSDRTIKVLKSSFGIGVYHVVMDEDGDFVRDATWEDYCHDGEWSEESMLP